MPIKRITTTFLAMTVLVLVSLAAPAIATATTLERIKESGRIRFGYFAEAQPFTSKAADGTVEGYGAVLCQRIAEQVKGELSLPDLKLDWVPVTKTDALPDIEQGSVDVLCTPLSVTLTRRQRVSYSLPVFPGGARAVVRADAPLALRQALSDTPSTKPVWRGSPAAKTLGETSVAVVAGGTTEAWLGGRIASFHIGANVVPVPDYKTGVQQLRDGKVQIFFGDRAAALGAMDPSTRNDFTVLDRLFTREQYALAVPRGDEDFRLLVDRALNALFASGDIESLYAKSFGAPDDGIRAFFKWNTLIQ
ncbi:amino acid ABC transporter substrate-binding protein [Povalibacter sp.]|uniref:amino acid ABC transporter substrate-binding protein n=1 Tax=Povalibacter sp. TaxID=1962978 RepID=UPI002F3F7842